MRHSLGSRLGRQLGKDALGVGFDRLRGDIKTLSDALVRQATGDQAQNIALARREGLTRALRRPPCTADRQL